MIALNEKSLSQRFSFDKYFSTILAHYLHIMNFSYTSDIEETITFEGIILSFCTHQCQKFICVFKNMVGNVF